jgi:hypothetical protein
MCDRGRFRPNGLQSPRGVEISEASWGVGGSRCRCPSRARRPRRSGSAIGRTIDRLLHRSGGVPAACTEPVGGFRQPQRSTHFACPVHVEGCACCGILIHIDAHADASVAGRGRQDLRLASRGAPPLHVGTQPEPGGIGTRHLCPHSSPIARSDAKVISSTNARHLSGTRSTSPAGLGGAQGVPTCSSAGPVMHLVMQHRVA